MTWDFMKVYDQYGPPLRYFFVKFMLVLLLMAAVYRQEIYVILFLFVSTKKEWIDISEITSLFTKLKPCQSFCSNTILKCSLRKKPSIEFCFKKAKKRASWNYITSSIFVLLDMLSVDIV